MNKFSNRGFTLFEVLIAFAILSISLVIIFDLWTGSVRRVSQHQQRTRALTLAQSLLDEQLAMRTGTAGSMEGSTSEFSWKIERKPHHITNPIVGFRWTQMEVSVDVEWASARGSDVLELNAIMLIR